MKNKFSERMGYSQPRTVIQSDSMDDKLRTTLWNTIFPYFFSALQQGPFYFYDIKNEQHNYFMKIWTNCFHLYVEDIPYESLACLRQVKNRYTSYQWYEVYDFIEFLINLKSIEAFSKLINKVLEEHLSGFRVINNEIVPIISEQEISSIESALQIQDTVSCHLEASLKLLSDRTKPDFRNSIKESISAVEALTKIIVGNSKVSLGAALSEIDRLGTVPIHKALSEGLSKIYGWTSDDQGIRHSLMDESNLSQEDAIFMLVVCSAFINYLSEKSRKIGLDLSKN